MIKIINFKQAAVLDIRQWPSSLFVVFGSTDGWAVFENGRVILDPPLAEIELYVPQKTSRSIAFGFISEWYSYNHSVSLEVFDNKWEMTCQQTGETLTYAL